MGFNHCEPPRLTTARPVGVPRLTMREHEVLRRIADGQSTRQIAKDLAIASSTARTHANNVLVKLGARSRIQAVATASLPPPAIAAPTRSSCRCRGEPDPLATLTRREREVLACMVEGLTQAAAADRLCLSPHTVRTHSRSILSKLGVHSALEAAAFVRRLDQRLDQRVDERHDRRLREPDRPG